MKNLTNIIKRPDSLMVWHQARTSIKGQASDEVSDTIWFGMKDRGGLIWHRIRWIIGHKILREDNLR